MPEINPNELKARQLFGLVGNSNPDLRIDGQWVDVKSPKQTKRLTRNAIRAAKQNAAACITDDRCSINADKLKEYADNILSNPHYNAGVVYFIVNGKLYKYNNR